MIIAILVGMLLGFVLAIPPGPIGMMSVKYSIDNGYKKAAEYSFGTAGMDMIFALIAVFAASAINNYLGDVITGNEIFILLFQIAVITGLIGFGILVLRSNQRKIRYDNDDNSLFGKRKSELFENLKTKGAFFFGIAFAFTNLANPAFLPFLAFLSIQVHKLEIIANSFTDNLLFGIGFGLGNFLWLNLLSRVVIRYKNKMNNATMGFINKFAGITFLSFAGIIIYRVLTVTKWPEIFRFAF